MIPFSNHGVWPILRVAAVCIAALAAAAMNGCTYYNVTPAGHYVVQSPSFDQSWLAVLGAYADENVIIRSQDRNTGVVRGSYNGIDLRTSVIRQNDGSVRVQFDTSGPTDKDPQLISRVTGAYNTRMGR